MDSRAPRRGTCRARAGFHKCSYETQRHGRRQTGCARARANTRRQSADRVVAEHAEQTEGLRSQASNVGVRAAPPSASVRAEPEGRSGQSEARSAERSGAAKAPPGGGAAASSAAARRRRRQRFTSPPGRAAAMSSSPRAARLVSARRRRTGSIFELLHFECLVEFRLVVVPGRRAWSSFAWSSCLVVVPGRVSPGRVSPGRRAWSSFAWSSCLVGGAIYHRPSSSIGGGVRRQAPLGTPSFGRSGIGRGGDAPPQRPAEKHNWRQKDVE
jgi:hypothetical protein